MWRLIAWSAFLSFGVLHLLVGALVLVVLIRHHIVECDEILALATEDLVHEYEKFRGNPSLIQQEMDSDVGSHGTDNLFLLISSPSGHVVASASASKSILRKMLDAAKDGAQGTYRFNRGRRNDLGRAISIRAKKTTLYDGNVLSVGYNVTDAEYNLIHVAMLLGAAMFMTLFVGAWLGAALARRFTAPLRNLAAAAERIADGDYTARVQASAAGWEIAQVEDAFNRMGDKNEKAMSDLRALTDDIAHDLRTPLTRLKAAAEVAALESAELNRPLPETVTDEVSAMLEMINTMLEISQTGCRLDRTPREDIDLCAFLRETVDIYATVLDDQKLALNLDLPKDAVVFSGHRGRLQRLLGNLLDNAIKFTPEGGVITLSLVKTTSTIVLRVSDTGCGIAPEDIPHVFRRFWRSDSSRSLPGNGLGLALAKAIVTSYAGTISCESTPGKGSTFTISIPVVT